MLDGLRKKWTRRNDRVSDREDGRTIEEEGNDQLRMMIYLAKGWESYILEMLDDMPNTIIWTYKHVA